jgi:Zn-dependent protease with chaperone function
MGGFRWGQHLAFGLEVQSMRTIKKLALVSILSLVSACSGIQLLLPEADQLAFNSALREIEEYPQPVGEKYIDTATAKDKVAQVYEKLLPAARKVCDFVDEQETCWWDIKYSSESEFNAYATDKNEIVVMHGVLARSSSDSELAMVVAHEIGHHIADHIDESKTQITIGAIIGAVAMGVLLDKAGPCYSVSCQQSTSDAIENSAILGAQIGKLSFSKKQEREADMLAAFILFNAGYDLYESRYMLVKMGAMDPDRKTSLLDTHPAGPDRLATYDKFIQTVYTDDDFMPNKKSNAGVNVDVRSPEPISNRAESKQGQDKRNNNLDTYSGSPYAQSWTNKKSNPITTPKKNKIIIISQPSSRATQNTRSQRYPTADSEHSDLAVKCFKKRGKYMCDTQKE